MALRLPLSTTQHPQTTTALRPTLGKYTPRCINIFLNRIACTGMCVKQEQALAFTSQYAVHHQVIIINLATCVRNVFVSLDIW